MAVAGAEAILREKLQLEYDEKLEETRRKLRREMDERLEQEKRALQREYSEKEEILRTKMELEIKKKEDVIREMYDMKLKRAKEDIRKQVELELKDRFAKEIIQKRMFLGGCTMRVAETIYAYPFTALIGQEEMKKSLIFNAINPALGGVLLWGERGTGKTTALRAIGEYSPSADDKIRCVKGIEKPNCRKCDIRYETGAFGTERFFISYTIDRVLNSAAVSIETPEGKGLSPSKIIVSMKTGEEEVISKLMLFNQIPLQVKVSGITDMEQRLEIIRRMREFRIDPEKFRKRYSKSQNVLYDRIIRAKRIINVVTLPDEIMRGIVKVCRDLNIDNHAVEGLIEQVARTESAYQGRHRVIVDDLVSAVELVLMYSWGISEKERMSKDQLEALVKLHTKR